MRAYAFSLVRNTVRFSALVGLAALLMAQGASAKKSKQPTAAPGYRLDGPLKCPMGRDYWIAAPEKVKKTEKYWLMVLVHGYRSNGSRSIDWHRRFAGLKNVIFVAPTFPSEGYQGLGKNSAKQLIDIFEKLKREYPLHSKMFVFGFSGGSQYAHRFALTYPDLVIGCSAHSGGSWGSPSKKAVHVPFFVSCGLEDASRIGGAKNFYEDLVKGGFFVRHRYWQEIGHRISSGVIEETPRTFFLATTGMFAPQREVVDREVERIRALISEGKLVEAKSAARALLRIKLDRPAPKPRDQVVARMRPEEREKLDPSLGLGGESKGAGKEFWVNDIRENEFGWQMGPLAMRYQLYQRRAYLKMLAESLMKEIERAGTEK